MVWKPGQSGNLNGRPRKYPKPPEGMAQNDYLDILKRDEYRYTAKEQNLEDPILFQHRLLSDESIPKAARAVIANQIAPYYRPKLGIMELPKYVITPIDIPDFQTIEDAESWLLDLARREAHQEYDSDSVATATERVRGWIQSKRAGIDQEIKRAAQGEVTGDQLIRIEGGLDPLPGTTITMPQLNGHTIDSLPSGATIDSTPAIDHQLVTTHPEVDAAPASAEAGAAQPIGKP
jgi:hypothetical protein